MKLIDKAALVAWAKETYLCENASMIRKVCYKQLLEHLDTLEVKEVDLEKEAELIANDIMIGVQANRYNTVVYNTKRCDFNHSHLMLAARKGIELGMQQSKKNDNNNEEDKTIP